jgi:hypothetical protein
MKTPLFVISICVVVLQAAHSQSTYVTPLGGIAAGNFSSAFGPRNEGGRDYPDIASGGYDYDFHPAIDVLVEAFNSRFRQECLNQHWFLSLEDAITKLLAWQNEYNTERPHSALGYRSPIQGESKSVNEEAAAA